MPDSAVCNACGWAGGIDDLRVNPQDNGADIAVCPDCLSTDVQTRGDG